MERRRLVQALGAMLLALPGVSVMELEDGRIEVVDISGDCCIVQLTAVPEKWRD